MTTVLDNDGMQILHGHVLDVLRSLRAQSIQCVVTSPPYWGLRDYGLEPVVWGGDLSHAHEWGEDRHSRAGRDWDPTLGRSPVTRDYKVSTGAFCSACSAWRGSLGLEPTPELYVEHLVAVFREVWRVLRDDGTCWINLGDSYAANRSYQVPSTKGGPKHSSAQADQSSNRVPDGLKPKDLIGIPWRVAFALQADGWYLRSDIIWAKPNPMPESVTDRPTKAHEYLFLLSKSARYFYDGEAIREPVSPNWSPKNAPTVNELGSHVLTNGQRGHQRRLTFTEAKGANRRSVWRVDPSTDVWDITTCPYKGAHFATFPPALVTPCVLAGSRVGDVVMDPFVGSGTVMAVAKAHGRRALGIELNLEYIQLAINRLFTVKSHAPLTPA